MMQRSVSETKQERETEVDGFQVIENECIWMRAGVVNFHICDNNYDCIDCSFDRKMRRVMDAQAPPKGKTAGPGWAEEMRKKYLGTFKPCVHFLAGRIGPPGNCARDYDCDDCPVDLMLDYAPLMQAIEAENEDRKIRSTRTEALGGEEKKDKVGAGFHLSDEECIWMRAGIINFHLCDNKYDCYNCAFDQSMREAMEGEYSPKKKLRAMDLEDQIEEYERDVNPCIHFLTGSNDAPAECSRNYECSDCPVHHYRANENEILLRQLDELQYSKASGYNMAEGYYYHLGHTWVHVIHGGCVKIGVDDFFTKVFGNTHRLELLPIGTSMKQGHVGWLMARNGHKAPIQSPLTGTVIAVNHKAMEDPFITHNDPYEEGWLFQLEPWFLKRESEALYARDDCLKWMEHENQDLLKLLGPDYEGLAATGGRPTDDLFGACPEIGWDRLVRRFLRTRKKR